MGDTSVEEFPLSAGEIDRRREAFTRLISFTAIGSVVSAVDLFKTHPVVVIATLVPLFALVLVSGAVLMKSFDRYVRTVWTLSETSITRDDGTSREEHALEMVRGVRVKRMVSGAIRAISVDFEEGRSAYVNALEDPEAFVEELVARCREGVTRPEVREPIDYDAPWFYRVLGLAVGITISSAIRVAVSADAAAGMWVQLGVAAYMLAFGAYWLHAKPFSASYGERRRSVDLALGLFALCAGVALAILALAM